MRRCQSRRHARQANRALDHLAGRAGPLFRDRFLQGLNGLDGAANTGLGGILALPESGRRQGQTGGDDNGSYHVNSRKG